MLLTVHNLPVHIRYGEIKELLKEKCGLKEILLDNLVAVGKSSKKVTVGVPNENDAATVVQKINGLYVGQQQLYVEDGRKKLDLEQPFRSTSNTPQQRYSEIQIAPPRVGTDSYWAKAPSTQRSNLSGTQNYNTAAQQNVSGYDLNNASSYNMPSQYMMQSSMMQPYMGSVYWPPAMQDQNYMGYQADTNPMGYSAPVEPTATSSFGNHQFASQTHERPGRVQAPAQNSFRRSPDRWGQKYEAPRSGYPDRQCGDRSTNFQRPEQNTWNDTKGPSKEFHEPAQPQNSWSERQPPNSRKRPAEDRFMRTDSRNFDDKRTKPTFVQPPMGDLGYNDNKGRASDDRWPNFETGRVNMEPNRPGSYGQRPSSKISYGPPQGRNEFERFPQEPKMPQSMAQEQENRRNLDLKIRELAAVQITNFILSKNGGMDNIALKNVLKDLVKSQINNMVGNKKQTVVKDIIDRHRNTFNRVKLIQLHAKAMRTLKTFQEDNPTLIAQQKLKAAAAAALTNGEGGKRPGSYGQRPSSERIYGPPQGRNEFERFPQKSKMPQSMAQEQEDRRNLDLKTRELAAVQITSFILSENGGMDNIALKNVLKYLVKSQINRLVGNKKQTVVKDIIDRHRNTFNRIKQIELHAKAMRRLKTFQGDNPTLIAQQKLKAAAAAALTNGEKPMGIAGKPVRTGKNPVIANQGLSVNEPGNPTLTAKQRKKAAAALSKIKNYNPVTRQKKALRLELQGKQEYKLDPSMEAALDAELEALNTVIKEACNDPENESDESVCADLKDKSGTEFINNINRLVKKRILNVCNELVIKVLCNNSRPQPSKLNDFLQQFGVTGVKKSLRGAFFMAAVDSHDSFDKILAMKTAQLDEATLTFKALHLGGKPAKLSKKQYQDFQKKVIRSQVESDDWIDEEETVQEEFVEPTVILDESKEDLVESKEELNESNEEKVESKEENVEPKKEDCVSDAKSGDEKNVGNVLTDKDIADLLNVHEDDLEDY